MSLDVFYKRLGSMPISADDLTDHRDLIAMLREEAKYGPPLDREGLLDVYEIRERLNEGALEQEQYEVLYDAHDEDIEASGIEIIREKLGSQATVASLVAWYQQVRGENLHPEIAEAIRFGMMALIRFKCATLFEEGLSEREEQEIITTAKQARMNVWDLLLDGYFRQIGLTNEE